MDNNLTILNSIIWPELLKTFYMVFFSTFFSTIFGFMIAIVLSITRKDGLNPNETIYKVLNTLINVIRSFPFIILMVAIIPLTRALVGTSIGPKAAIVPLTVVVSPFIARLIESSLNEVDKGLIEAAKSFGASNLQIVFKVMIKESIPLIISSITLAIISIIGFSSMAGALGAGGLGAVALTYGYQSFNTTIMYGTVVVIIFIVQIVQATGNFLYRKLK
ncbi:DL-methionine transporter subunit; membrane component protein of ABC superfamily [Acetoanaerobium sticklandii]|uniref:DL-methionine transporter subunit membrane component protein of ABC superfamily n=1 Tax=Acetoanaerobium sticklandii (strain ATCC 12662 / DSM 519 / JCM 1433 / CCUG 9281 / NCIMB 10654 / HF) TaxID=499177 RepID=E3PR24_ACESD|nr:ABC transporter permease subunit [Acetoanaerobium sticklandii]CBH20220.1 DL-methionine transporter subunit; membrane component protein of ABC superfamily [Acetoanaerobium sticklandii]